MKKLNTLFALTFTLSQFCSFPIYAQTEDTIITQENDEADEPVEPVNEDETSEEKTPSDEIKKEEIPTKQEENENLVLYSDDEIETESEEVGVEEEQDEITLDEDYFPDKAFRTAIIEETRVQENQILSREVLDKVTEFTLSGITDLTGIEYFTNLKTLNISDSDLTSLDVNVSSLTVSSLNVSKCTSLESLSISYWTEEVIVRDCTSLQKITFGYSKEKLKKMDLINCSSLEELDCSMSGLNELNLSGCASLKKLDCSGSHLTSLDLSDCTSLEELKCSNLTRSGSNLTTLDLSDCASLTVLDCADNSLTELDLRNNPLLTTLNCSSNKLKELNLNNNTELEYLNCCGNELASLDLSSNNKLTEENFIGFQNINLDIDGTSITLQELSPNIIKGKIFDVENMTFDQVNGIFQNINFWHSPSGATRATENLSNTENRPSSYKYKCNDDLSISVVLYNVGKMASATVEGVDESYTYTGEEINPKPVVTLHNRTLKEGRDYVLSYSDNVDLGTATITITGRINFEGEIQKEFTIVPKKTDVETLNISGINESYQYSGEAITPKPIIKFEDTTLEEGTDYTISYSSNIEAGNASITITGIGNYSGTVTKEFTITPEVVNEENIIVEDIKEIEDNNIQYEGSDVKPTPVIKWHGKVLKENVDYKISYIYRWPHRSRIMTFASKTTTNTGILEVTITGIGSFKGTITKTYEVLPTPIDDEAITVSGINASYSYSGTKIEPTPVIQLNGNPLKEGTDYTLSYSNNVNAGKATITITGINGISGTLEKTFSIQATTIANASVDGVNTSYTYTGKAITPVPTVKWNGKTLVNNTDYTLAYSSNTNAGTAKITITGKGNYSGTITKEFKISAASISSASISGVNASYTYTGKEIKPAPTITLNGKTLVNNTDYTLAYSSNTNSGTAKITITGKGNYSGSVTKEFKISAASISSASISGVNASYTYTGKEIKPTPVITLNGKTLVNNTDYTLAYSSNTNVGTAKITITGKGNYSGTVTKTFTIVENSVKMYRLYNPNSGEHFYTKDSAEKNNLVKLGWKYEGIGWNAPSKSNTPVYRLYNPNAGDHHYTMNVNEKNSLVKVGWNYEGIGWYSDDAKGVPLYRQYNPNAKAGSHNYTTSKAENDSLIKVGWKGEGIGWYGTK